jgi:hypothetical protein
MSKQAKRQGIRRRTISLPVPLLTQGLERARRDNRNFSSYVQSLVQRDVENKDGAAAAVAS